MKKVLMDIKESLPHREPFLFIDEVVEVGEGKILAKREIREDEPQFEGHYPGNPIMPGVLSLEAMFQAGALLMVSMMADGKNGAPVVTRVNQAKFKKIMTPGDTMMIEVEFEEKMANAYMFKGKVKSDGKLAASADFTCSVIPDNKRK